MTLTNYWWLLIWLAIGGAGIRFVFPKKTEMVLGEPRVRWSATASILLVLPLILWAGFRPVNLPGFDTSAYVDVFKAAPSTLDKLPEYLTTITKDKGFSVLTVLLKAVVGDSPELYLLVIAAFQLLCVALVFRKYSCDYWLSIFIFVASTEYISWMYNGIRQFTAVAAVFAASALLFRKKYISLILIILLASTIHGSVLLMLPIIFIVQGKAFNSKTLLCVCVIAIALLCVNQFTDLLEALLSNTQYQNVVSDWKMFNDDGMNPLRALIYSLPAIFAILGRRFIRKEQDPVIHIAANASVITAALSWLATVTSGIFIGRLPILVSLYATGILLPWEINTFFTQKSARFIKAITLLCYAVFFYYQVHTWRIM